MKGKRRFLAIIIAFSMMLSLIQAPIVSAEQGSNDVTSSATRMEYEGAGFRVNFEVTAKWGENFNANVSVQNTGDEVIDNWALGFVMPYEINDIWSAVIFKDKSSNYIIKNDGTNQDIQPGESVVFGFSGKGMGDIKFPEDFFIMGRKELVDPKDYQVSFQANETWEGGCMGQVTIKNLSEQTIEDWILEFDFPTEIEDFKSGCIISHEGYHYVVKNAGYNANIAAGESVLSLVSGEHTIKDGQLENVKMYQIATMDQISVDFELDSDQDNIPDYNEKKLGTDKYKADTDDDGLNDYIELACGYDPLKPDTDDNGVNDGDEDLDSDGLTNIEELQLGTDISDMDTDSDDLLDGEEVNTYNTDPLTADTDKDSILDGDELKFGLDPLKEDTDDDGILDPDALMEHTYRADELLDDYDPNVYPILDIKGDHETLSSFTMQVKDQEYLLNPNVPGYIGTPYEFHVDKAFESAKVTFVLAKSLFVEDFEPAIYYFNEETQLLEYVEDQTCEENLVSASLEHFSTYIVLNKKKFDEVWKQEIHVPQGNKPFDMSFVLDASGSMSYDARPKNDKDGLRIKLSIEMVEKLSDKDRASVVSFASSEKLLQSLSFNKDDVISAINKVGSYGATAMFDGIMTSIKDYNANSDANHEKVMIVLTDGVDNDSYYSSQDVITEAVKSNIKIHMIGLGTRLDEPTMKRIASSTGGNYYYAEKASDLKDVYKEVEEDTIDWKKDSNNDGISDYYTKLLCEGDVRTGTGLPLFKGLPYELVQANADFDGDGLKNGEEVQIEGHGSYFYIKVVSNPLTKVSDLDSYTDYEEVKIYDTNPLKSNLCVEMNYVDFLGDHDRYNACAYEDEFLDSTAKQVSAWIGNNIFGSNYDEKEIYQDALVNFFMDINETNQKKSELMEYAKLVQSYSYEVSLVVEQARSTGEFTADTIDYMLDLEKQIEHIRCSIVDLEKSAASYSKADFYKLYDELQDTLKTTANKSNSLKKSLNKKVTVKGKLHTIAQGKTAKALSKTFSWGCNILQGGIAVMEGVDDYCTLKANLSTIQDNIYILEVISEGAYYDSMKSAAKTLLSAARNNYVNAVEEITQALASAVLNIALHTAIAAIPVVGFWIELSLCICNLLIPVSDASLYAVRICGDSCMSVLLFNDLYKYLYDNDCGFKSYESTYIWVLSSEYAQGAVQRYINLAESRIFGEKDLITLEEMGPGWLNWLCDKLGFDRQEIIDDCKSNIKDVSEIQYRYVARCCD